MHIMAVWQGVALVITQHCVTVTHVRVVLGDPTTSYLYWEDTINLRSNVFMTKHWNCWKKMGINWKSQKIPIMFENFV